MGQRIFVVDLWSAIHTHYSYHNNGLNGNIVKDGTSSIIDVNQVNGNETPKRITVTIKRACHALPFPVRLQGRILSTTSTQMRQRSTKETGSSEK